MSNNNPNRIGPNRTGQLGYGIRTAVIGAMLAVSTSAMAAKNVTLIQVSDLHGNMLPHAGIIEAYGAEPRYTTQSGGMAKVATIVKEIRASVAANQSLTLGVGDSTHGSAETLFTMGDSIMPAINALGLEAFTPGNWDFAYGPAVMRHRYVDLCKAHPEWQNPPQVNPLCPPLPANVRVMVDSDGMPGVTAANFPILANNLYNGGPYPPSAPFWGKRTFAPYKIFEKDGVKIAVIGITSSIIPQQPPVFGRTFDFSQGVEELQGDIDAAKAEGATFIVVMSELGLPQNVQIAREFPDVHVVLSAHSHEVTLGAIVADAEGFEMVDPNIGPSDAQLARLKKGGALVVEAGEDLYVGRLDLRISDEGDKIKDFTWAAIPADDDVAEDDDMAAIVASQEKYFVDGPDFKTHSFLPAAFCTPTDLCAPEADGAVHKGLRLVDPLDIVVGSTDVLLHRHEDLEGVMNNFIADAFLDTLAPIANAARPEWASLDVVSMTNGFRFDTVILPASLVPVGKTFRDGREPGDVTLRDLWSYFPTAAGLVAADYAGVAIEESMNNILTNVFSPNPYIQRGGWYVGMSNNMKQRVDVIRRPFSTSGMRIVDTRINGNLLNPSKRYIIASCYGHTFAIGRSCRTEGGANMLFYQLADGDDYESAITTVDPIPTPGGAPLIDNKTPGSPMYRAAPNNYLHPIHALRLYLDKVGNINELDHGTGRVVHVNSRMVDPITKTFVVDPIETHHADEAIVQSIEGLGPNFLERNIIIQK